MTPHRPSRRSFLATLTCRFLASGLALSLTPASALADVVYEPPPALDVRPLATTYTTPPTSIEVLVSNASGEAIVTSGVRLVVLTAGVRVPLRVSRLEVDGQQRGVWSEITFAPRAGVRVRISFDEVPASSLAAGRIDFALRLGQSAESTFSLSHASR